VRRAVSRPVCANETNPALSVDRTLLGTSTIGPHPADRFRLLLLVIRPARPTLAEVPLADLSFSGLRRGFFVARGSKDEQRQLPDRLGRFRSTRTLLSVKIASMTTAEAIYERALALPESLRREALHYLEYLLQRRDAAGQRAADEEAAWTRLSAEQLASHYGPDDAVYDSP
jgi:hypothetical protein